MYDARYLTPIVWTSELIVERNLFYRGESIALDGCRFEDFVMFADDGAGGPFMLPTCPSDQTIYWWYPHDDVFQEVAPDFATYIDRWIADTL